MSSNKGSKRPAQGQGAGPSAPSAHSAGGTNLGELMTQNAGVTPFEHHPTPATPATVPAAAAGVATTLFQSPVPAPPSSPTAHANTVAPESPAMAALRQAAKPVAVALSPTAPRPAKTKNGKKVTETSICVCYSWIDGEKLYLGFFLWNCFDRYLWFKGDVQYENEPFCNPETAFMYPPRKFALLEAAGFARPGPLYLPLNSPVWRYIVTMTDGVESMRDQSKKIEEMVQQTVRLVDGTVDASNGGNDFSVIVTEKELQPAEWAMLFCLRQ
jgi:hypothetical protein